MAYVIVVSPELNMAYRKDAEGIMETPILIDGSISTEYDDWQPFSSTDAETISCVTAFFENLNQI